MDIVGVISPLVESLLNISISYDRRIYLGSSNIAHMETSHPYDYARYRDELSNILSNPDYVGINPGDNSIEYVKEYKINNEFVKVAIRISTGEKYYARSLYILNNSRVHNFISKGTLKKLSKGTLKKLDIY